MIKQGKTYKVNKGSILFTVHKIYYTGKEYIKVKGSISDKQGYVYETKGYKIKSSVLQRWEKCLNL